MECGDAMDNTFLWEADPRKSYGESLLQGDSDNKKVAQAHEQLNFLIFKKVAI